MIITEISPLKRIAETNVWFNLDKGMHDNDYVAPLQLNFGQERKTCSDRTNSSALHRQAIATITSKNAVFILTKASEHRGFK